MCTHNSKLYANNVCAACDRDRNDKYRDRRKLAMKLLRTAEARGLCGQEALALLQEASYSTLQECLNAPAARHWERFEQEQR